MTATIVDTNVILVANGQHQDVSDDCQERCIDCLLKIKREGQLVLDDAYEVLEEYRHKTLPNRGKRVGDAFIKWVLNNLATPEKCSQIHLEKDAQGEYVSFPDDPDLQSFDPPDRKFVALAAAHEDHPPILQAVDCKWLDWAPALTRNEIEVEFICPADIRRFHEQKFGS